MNLLRILFICVVIFAVSQPASATPYDERVHYAQKRLNKLGYNPGVIDGLWGENTKRAVEQFQKAKGLTVTGTLDSRTLEVLMVNAREAATQPYPWLMDNYKLADSIAERIKPPIGYERVATPKQSFEQWLRFLPLKAANFPVLLFNGKRKGNQSAQYAVVDVDIGSRDLQQCADAVMRLKAEYLFSAGEYSDIHFNFTSGHKASYIQWRQGYRPIVHGNSVTWKTTTAADPSYTNFRKYLDIVFTYAGTSSFSKELISIDASQMKIGDIFLKGGFPGHAVIVVDMAINKESGEKLFMLVQSYMPAQNIHILKNPSSANISPWYRLKFGPQLITPEWTFTRDQLKRFK